MATLMVTGRADLTDAQWAVLEPLLPAGRKPGRPPKWTKRQLIDGIRPGPRPDRPHRNAAGEEETSSRPCGTPAYSADEAARVWSNTTRIQP